MIDPTKVSLLYLFFTVLIFGFAIPSTTSTATTVAVKTEASTTPPTVAAVVSRDQVTCTISAECDNPCKPVPSTPPPPPEVECPPPPSPPPPEVECPPPPSPPPPEVECPPLPMPPACSVCETPESQSIYVSPPPPNPIVSTFPYYYRPEDYGASSSLHSQMNAAVFATSLVLSGTLYVLHF
ncbi:leucine-rich repeat extensin-like protein 3 [Syzygium oleosum]|uniref:leucine-rich repeat extensin-like protein 3 n=1 Tax=Syzygium oleosum TaxID=219896 RepID=UPI0024BAC2AF|nr:leucine-rich repeat extensin-like protein 3 [Syzygium oleosum]